ncbi:hypothetical protein [Paraburkholderia phenoliruptrix]|uniref:hypothetical protein n=1 Tax=Paraburkholderia phenoliruptrix TaxID=252970 RepID=UPI0039B5B3F0
MQPIEKRDEEAAAVAGIAEAAREAQVGSAGFAEHFHDAGGAPSTLVLARLAAAMPKLQAARDAFDAPLAASHSSGNS